MTSDPEIRTDRLLLRRHRRADFDGYAAMWAEPEVVRRIGGVPFTREQSWARFLRIAGCWHHMGFGYFAVTERASGRYLGEAGFQEALRGLEPSIEGTLEAGWGLFPEHWGAGIASEAVRGLVAWADRTLTGRRMTCLIDADHPASRRIAEKVGFRRFAETSYNGKAVVLLERTATPRP